MNPKQNKILVWMVITLLIVNLSVLGTLIWMRFFTSTPVTESVLSRKYDKHKKHFRFHDNYMKEKIGFNDDQMEMFVSLRAEHFEKIKALKAEIDSTRSLQFYAIQNDMIEKEYLDSLIYRIGLLHRKWAKLSTDFMLNAKEICTPEQEQKFFKMLKNSRRGQFRGCNISDHSRSRHPYRHGRTEDHRRRLQDGE